MNRASSVAIVIWAALLTAVLTVPWFGGSMEPGEELVRNTVRLSLAYYSAAVGLMLFLDPSEWRGRCRGVLARWCWSLAWVTYVIHVGMAFHFYHGWSHADAVRHTEEVSGFGPGIYVSHLFTLVWTLDVCWWWLRPGNYAGRPAWIGRTLHAFMAFIIFNGMVVYETGMIRWAGAVMFVALGSLWFLARRQSLATQPAPRIYT